MYRMVGNAVDGVLELGVCIFICIPFTYLIIPALRC